MKIVVPLLVLLLLACGATTVTIRVDVRSFMSEADLSLEYDTPGDIPEVEISDIEIIPLPEEVNSLTDLVALEVSAAIDFDNHTGSTQVIYNIYFGAAELSRDELLDTPYLVVSDTVALDSASYVRDDIVIEGDERLLNLFSGDEFAMGSKVQINPAGGPDVTGQADIVELIVMIQAAGEE